MHNQPNILILTIDGLGSRDLGAYGNTWIETPNFDRLAARSLLFEHVLINTTQPDWSLASMAVGQNVAAVVGQPHSVLAGLRAQGVSTILFSDRASPFPEALAESSFERRVAVDAASSRPSAAEWEETHCANFFAQLIEVRKTLPQPHCLWAHYVGLSNCWDAPHAWRQRMVDEGDPDPPTWTNPPEAVLTDRDPDLQLPFYQAFAAEIMVLDACLDPLLDELTAEAQIRFLLASPRGYPLGEHAVVGHHQPILYSELTSVPLMITDFSAAIGWRSQELVQPSRVAEYIRDAYPSHGNSSIFRVGQAEVAASQRRAVCLAQRASALRTPEWLLIQGSERRELYAKPDDRWESNEVSSRCHEVVENLIAENLGLSTTDAEAT